MQFEGPRHRYAKDYRQTNKQNADRKHIHVACGWPRPEPIAYQAQDKAQDVWKRWWYPGPACCFAPSELSNKQDNGE